MKDFRKLKVWKKSHDLTLAVYKATADFPGEERYGLISQIRRACASIPATLPKTAEEVETPSWHVSCKSLWDLPANWNTTYSYLTILVC